MSEAEKRVSLLFPVWVKIGGVFEGTTRELGGIKFVNGISEGPVSYNVSKLVGANYKLYELFTGVRLHPSTERSHWVAAGGSRMWNHLRPIPEEVKALSDSVEELRKGNGNGQEGNNADGHAKERQPDYSVPTQAGEAVEQREAGDSGGLDSDNGRSDRQANDSPEEVEAYLRELLTRKGAKFIRTLCEERDVQTARNGEQMLPGLAAVMTLEEIKTLLES